jgi:hypothetical protein
LLLNQGARRQEKKSLTAVLMKNFIESANNHTNRNFFTLLAVVAEHAKHDFGRSRNLPGISELLNNDMI